MKYEVTEGFMEASSLKSIWSLICGVSEVRSHRSSRNAWKALLGWWKSGFFFGWLGFLGGFFKARFVWGADAVCSYKLGNIKVYEIASCNCLV